MKANGRNRLGWMWIMVLCLMCGMSVRGQLLVDSVGNAYFGDYNSLSSYKAALNVKGQACPAILCVPGIAPAIQTDYPYVAPMLGSPLFKGSSKCSAVSFIQYELNDIVKFYVNGNGAVMAQNYLTPSDSLYKKDITVLTSSLEKVRQLRGVSYRLKEGGSRSISLDSETGIKSAQIIKEKEDKEAEIRLRMEQESLRPRIGLIAQEVESVVPEAVYTLLDGKKGISYTSLIGLLIEAIKEQDAKVSALETELSELKERGNFQRSASGSEKEISREKAVLYQNAPNPFNRETRIRYFLPSGISKANLLIYDLQGKQLKNYKLAECGEACQVIAARELGVGMYIYALVADGSEIDQKRMIITE